MKTYFVDSFTNEKFKGNPAAVCLVDSALVNNSMQNIAMEIGFSETAFVQHINSNIYSIRFFTPKMEIPLCGHATLAAAKILFEINNFEELKFINCNEVALPIEKEGAKIKMQFPVYETEPVDVPQKMLQALGITESLNTRYSPTNKIIIIEIASAVHLRELNPNFTQLTASYAGINGVLVTAISDNPEYDFHYRYFWPWAGTNEDPVTGGVQTFLTKYWSQKLNKTRLQAFQSSERTGSMSTELIGDKVFILGEAIKILEGEFYN